MAPAHGRLSNRTTLLAIAAVAVATAAVSLAPLNRLKDAVIAARLHSRPLSLAGLTEVLGTADVVLVALAVATLLVLVRLEVRQRACSRLLATATTAEIFTLLTILIAWFGHSYLSPGVLLGGDTGTHIARFLEVQRGLDAGALPVWTNYQYAGAPLLWFTGPLTYVVGGVIAFVVRDAVLATKILLFTLHMLSGWAFFALLRRLGIRAVPAMLAAAGFAGSFAHLHLFLFRGVVPQAFTILFLVLLFHSADGLLRDKGARWANGLVFSLATAGMIVNHQPHALFAALYLVLFGGLALVSGFWNRQGIPVLVAAGVLGAITAVIAVVPILAESDWVMIEPETTLFRLHLPTISRLLNLVLWRDTRTTWGIDYWAYLGFGLIVFGAAGVTGMVRGRLRAGPGGIALPAAVCLALCLVLYNPVVRDIMFVLFFLGLLAALGFDWLLDRPVLAGRRLLAATLLVIVDLASTSVQPVARTDKGFMIEAGRLLERVAPNQRILQIGIAGYGALEADIGPDAGPLSYYATVQRTAGNHNMAATRMHNYLAVAAKQAATELQSLGALSPETRMLLGLFDVGRIICNTALANGCPASASGTENDAVLGLFIPVAAMPAVFSQRLVLMAAKPGLDKPMLWPEDFHSAQDAPRIGAVAAELWRFAATEDIDGATRTAAVIAVNDDAVATGVLPASGPWHAVILDYGVGLTSVTLQVEADAPGFVQLSHPWFPSTRVTVNGVATQAIRGTIDLMVVPIQPGISVIELRDGWTAIRWASAMVSLCGLFAIGAAAAMLAWHDRSRLRQLHVAAAGL